MGFAGGISERTHGAITGKIHGVFLKAIFEEVLEEDVRKLLKNFLETFEEFLK